jgi:hypothetical protein
MDYEEGETGFLVLKPSFLFCLLYWRYNPVCGFWPPPWFRSSKFFRGRIVSPVLNPQHVGPGTTFRLAPTV